MEKEELDKKKMQVDMCRFRIGDIVQIPKEMLDEYKEEKSIPDRRRNWNPADVRAC